VGGPYLAGQERANRDIALRSGNWTFFGSDSGGKTTAVRIPRGALAHPGALYHSAERIASPQLATGDFPS
jgi:hypothetical protein